MADRQRLICRSDELVEKGKGVKFTVARYDEDEPAFAVRYRGQVYAYLNRCAHVPIELDWNPGEFFDITGLYLICATHGAHYLPETGACAGGRCNGRGLRPLHVCERDGGVYLVEGEESDA